MGRTDADLAGTATRSVERSVTHASPSRSSSCVRLRSPHRTSVAFASLDRVSDTPEGNSAEERGRSEMDARARVAAVIVRDGHVLMVRERGRGPSGRHDGRESWTLPGGGVRPGETPEVALTREVAEEVGLTLLSARHLYDFPLPSGRTACFAVAVPDGEEPRLGADPELTCDCPRLVGLEWVPLPTLRSETGGTPVPVMLLATRLDE
jgi:8-oxo-dGTP diphosphatase